MVVPMQRNRLRLRWLRHNSSIAFPSQPCPSICKKQSPYRQAWSARRRRPARRPGGWPKRSRCTRKGSGRSTAASPAPTTSPARVRRASAECRRPSPHRRPFRTGSRSDPLRGPARGRRSGWARQASCQGSEARRAAWRRASLRSSTSRGPGRPTRGS